MENNIKVLKLITGEEIISRVTESDINITENDEVDLLILEKPLSLTLIKPNTTGQMKIGMSKWIMAGKSDNITIEVKHVLVILDPTPEIESSYLSRITGLTLQI